jgi:hypothetical protein
LESEFPVVVTFESTARAARALCNSLLELFLLPLLPLLADDFPDFSQLIIG